MRFLSLVLVAAMASCGGSAPTADTAAARRPPALSSHVMTFHSGLGITVMFGGSDEDRNPTGTLWGWNGTRWVVLAERGPAPRLHTALAYDESRDRLVLYGGILGPETSTGDTWEWDGMTWQAIGTPGGSPGIRDHHAMAYDATRQVVVLFGGQNADDDYPGDTWTWDGTGWTLAAEVGPAPRGTHRLIWDPIDEGVVLTGGWGAAGMMNDAWMWNGTGWSEQPTAAFTPRGAARAAFDRVLGQLVVFGGLTDGGSSDETWIRQGVDWRRVEGPAPPARNVHGMAYDPVRGRSVMYGGVGDGTRLADLWEWDGRAWRLVY